MITGSVAMESLIERIRTLSYRVARSLPAEIPADVDSEFAALASEFRAADKTTQDAVRAGLTRDDSGSLMALGARSAEWALSSRSEQEIINSLSAHAMEDFRVDRRDNDRHLVLTWYAAEELKLDPRKVFKASKPLFSRQGASLLMSYVNGPSYTKTLKAMGMEAGKNGNQVTFRSIPPRSQR